MKNFYLLGLAFLFSITLAQAQTPVSSVTTSTKAATPFSYTVGGTTYNWGTGDDVYLETVTIGADVYSIDTTIVQRDYEFVRVDNTLVTGERQRIFGERTNNTTIKSSFPADGNGEPSMEIALQLPIVNSGALDVFHNVNGGSQNANNIERLDVITTPIIAPATALLDEIGFIASEKNGNNEYKVAAITSVDANGKPASYGTLRLINGAAVGNSYGEFAPSYLFRFLEPIETSAPYSMPEGYHNSDEMVGYSLVTFDDLGILEGQVIYGVSFFGKDVDDAFHDLVDPTTFPDNTNEGADVHGGLGAVFSTSNISLAELVDTDGDGVLDTADLDDDNDGIPDVFECQQDILINSGFESLPGVAPEEQFAPWGCGSGSPTGDYLQFNEADVDGWETTASDGAIEIWESTHCGGDPAPTPSHEGSYHLEICANEVASLFQSISSQPGSIFSWSIWHRGWTNYNGF